MNDNTIYIDDLSVEFLTSGDRIHAVDHVSLNLRHNEVTGIIGETGCGKSVLGMSLLRLNGSEAKVSGRLSLGNLDINALKGKELRRFRNDRLALIPQNPSSSLNPIIRIGTQLKKALLAVERKNRGEERIDSVLSSLGFPAPSDIRGKYTFQLSGGMNERVLIALGLIREPLWLLADEPTKGLDWTLRTTVEEILKNLVKERKKGIILITHDIPLAKQLCQRIIVMYGAAVLEDGPSPNIMNTPFHPYTRALIQSLPENGFCTIPGPPIGIGSRPSGCRFHPRCPMKTKICETEEPQMVPVADHHYVRCFLYA
jgi:peptide/nickel transport system ATP-binding protein